jgi:hypothetical protein
VTFLQRKSSKNSGAQCKNQVIPVRHPKQNETWLSMRAIHVFYVSVEARHFRMIDSNYYQFNDVPRSKYNERLRQIDMIIFIINWHGSTAK